MSSPIKRIVTAVEMTDGTVHDEIRPILADQMAYTNIRMKHKGYPAPSEDPMIYAAVQTWAALRREGHFVGSWDKFQNECAAIEVKSYGEDVDPTE